MDKNTQVRKWKKHRLSKRKYPTHVKNNGNEGVLLIGHIRAGEALTAQLGRSIAHMKTMHTKFEWVWAEPIKR